MSERGGHWGPSWAPDGQRLAFYSGRDGVARVWLWERASGRLRRVSDVETRTGMGFERPLWTPDGRALVVKLFTTDVAHAGLTFGVPRIAHPPDTVPGSTLVLYRSAPPAADTAAVSRAAAAPGTSRYDDIGIIDVGRSRLRRIRQRVSSVWYQLSPDGRWLAYLEQSARTVPTEGVKYELRLIELGTGT